MTNSAADNSSLLVGRLQGVELRVHILAPLAALVILLATKLPVGESNLIDARTSVAGWTFLVLLLSTGLHELARAVTAVRMGGHASSLVLGPIGGLTKLHLPVDPPAHLMTALAGPTMYLVLLVTAGCGLVLTGDYNLFDLLLNPCSPKINIPSSLPAVISDSLSGSGIGVGSGIGATSNLGATTIELVAQLTVWVNWCLLLLSFLPVDPCAGAELLRGLLWPMVGRATATSATSRIALGGALFFALLAVMVPQSSTGTSETLPAWFPLSVIAIFLLYGGYHNAAARRLDLGLAIDEFDSDDEPWLLSEWEEENREVVLVEHLQDKQQEAIDRKRREREANEDAEVDAILLRLRNLSFDQLPEEDRALLKRASRRYRERRETPSNHD